MNFSDTVLAANQGGPDLSPATQVALAQLGMSPDDTHMAASAISIYSKTQQLKTNMLAHDANTQSEVWKQLDADTQNSLRNAQYAPPETSKSSGGFLHSVANLAGDTLHVAWQPFHAVGYVAKEGLHVAGWAGEQAQHAQRAVEETGAFDKLFHSGQAIGLKDWSNAWDATKHANTSIDPKIRKSVQSQYGDDVYNLAMNTIKGQDPKIAVQNADPTERQNLFNMYQSKEYGDAFQTLAAGRDSWTMGTIGHLVGPKSYTDFLRNFEGPSLGQLLTGRLAEGGSIPVLNWHLFSGSNIDAATNFYINFKTDPSLIGFNKVQEARAAYKNITSGEEYMALVEKSKSARAFNDSVSKTWNEGGPAAITKRFGTTLDPFMDTFTKSDMGSGNSVARVFADNADAISRATGNPTVLPLVGTQNVYRLTPFNRALTNFREYGTKTIDFLHDLKQAPDPTELATSLRQKGIVSSFGAAVKTLPRTIVSAPGDLIKAVVSPIDTAKAAAGNLGNTLRKVTTIVENQGIDPTKSESVRGISNWLRSFNMPTAQVDEHINNWVSASNIGARKDVYKSIINDVLNTAGVDPEQTQKMLEQLDSKLSATLDANSPIESLSQAVNNQSAYGTAGSTLMRSPVDETTFEVGHLQNHATVHWEFPDYNTARALSAKGTTASLYQATFDSDTATKFMQELWKPEQLLRLGMPIRVSLEEGLGYIIRNGAGNYVKGLGASLLSDKYDKYANFLDNFLSHVPGADQEALKAKFADGSITAHELIGHGYGWQGFKAAKTIVKQNVALGGMKLLPQDYIDAVTRAAKHDLYNTAAARDILTHDAMAGYADMTPGAHAAVKAGFRVVPKDEFTGYLTSAEDNYLPAWRGHMKELLADSRAKYVIDHIADDPAEVQRHIADMLEASPEYTSQMLRSVQDSAGNLVGRDIEQRGALEDWARVIHSDVLQTFTGADGELTQSVLRRLSRSEIPTLDHLKKISPDNLPQYMKAQQYELVPQGIIKSWTQKGFKPIENFINSFSRKPAFIDQLTRNTVDLQRSGLVDDAIRLGMNPDDADRMLALRAAQRAGENIKPFIHDPDVRSQFSNIMRNVLPFQFAQEQFYKRWARTLVQSPAGIRKTQLVFNGITHMGFIQPDSRGNDAFYYPAAPITQRFIAQVSKLFGGEAASIPVVSQLTGELQNMIPGADLESGPGVSPLISMPLTYMEHRYPELTEGAGDVLGVGQNKPYLNQLLPAWAVRVFAGTTGIGVNKEELMSATNQAIQYMASIDADHVINYDATGQPIYDDSYKPLIPQEAQSQNNNDREAFVQRVKDYARTVMIVRGAYGFAAPAAPGLKIDRNDLSEAWHSALANSGGNIDNAYERFLTEHPDGAAYTVSQSKSISGAPLPGTQEAVNFMNQHEDFLKTHPYAASYFMPQTPGDLSPAAYQEQLSMGLRQRKAPEEFLNDVYYQQAANDFYSMRQHYETAISTKSGAAKANITNAYDQWKQAFFQMHPVFAEDYTSSDSARRRSQVIIQMRAALSSPDAPENSTTKALRELMYNYDSFHTAIDPYQGLTNSYYSNLRKQQGQQFATWVVKYIADHPETKTFFQRNLQPDTAFSSKVVQNILDQINVTETSVTNG